MVDTFRKTTPWGYGSGVCRDDPWRLIRYQADMVLRRPLSLSPRCPGQVSASERRSGAKLQAVVCRERWATACRSMNALGKWIPALRRDDVRGVLSTSSTAARSGDCPFAPGARSPDRVLQNPRRPLPPPRSGRSAAAIRRFPRRAGSSASPEAAAPAGCVQWNWKKPDRPRRSQGARSAGEPVPGKNSGQRSSTVSSTRSRLMEASNGCIHSICVGCAD
jgi:hypothetical protein